MKSFWEKVSTEIAVVEKMYAELDLERRKRGTVDGAVGDGSEGHHSLGAASAEAQKRLVRKLDSVERTLSARRNRKRYRRGVPTDLRPKVWMVVSGALRQKMLKKGTYQRYLRSVDEIVEDIRAFEEIEQDWEELQRDLDMVEQVQLEKEGGGDGSDGDEHDQSGNGETTGGGRPSGKYFRPSQSTAAINSSGKSTKEMRDIFKQIDTDAPRVLQDLPRFQEGGHGRESLRRILRTFCWETKFNGYSQWIGLIGGLYVEVVDNEEDAFWMLYALLHNICPPTFFTSLDAFRVDLLILQELFRQRIPDATQRLETLQMSVDKYAGRWFLSMYIRTLPLDCVLRVWDILHGERRNKILFKVALVLMRMHEADMMDFSDEAEAGVYVSALGRSLRDPDDLIKQCFDNKVTGRLQMSLIEARRRKYDQRSLVDDGKYDKWEWW
uniref:Rab-GAP TBC domain-containing protein n=1 Tax=Palpitomonas bilix TaxID=652834 RepID=A0A7S3DB67_9EUKA